MRRSDPATISSNVSLERRIIDAVQQLQRTTKIIYVPLADCTLVMPDTKLPGQNVNDDIEVLNDTKSWDARCLCTALPYKSRTRYCILSVEFYMAAALTAKVPRAYLRLLPLFYEDLGGSDINLVRTFVGLASPSPTRIENGIMRQVHEMMTILKRQELRPTFTP